MATFSGVRLLFLLLWMGFSLRPNECINARRGECTFDSIAARNDGSAPIVLLAQVTGHDLQGCARCVIVHSLQELMEAVAEDHTAFQD